jgi:hypothetical protein
VVESLKAYKDHAERSTRNVFDSLFMRRKMKQCFIAGKMVLQIMNFAILDFTQIVFFHL